MNRRLFLSLVIGSIWLEGCVHPPVVVIETPPILPPAQPQQTVMIVPLSSTFKPYPMAGMFHEDLKAALRRTQCFQILDAGAPWPTSCTRPRPGDPIDLRQVAADLQRRCPSTYSILYEITQLTSVRPMKFGVRVLVIRTADGSAVVDYDGVWDAPTGPPPPPRRTGFLWWAKCEPIVAYDPLMEVSPRILGQTAARDIALMLSMADHSQWATANCAAPSGFIISNPVPTPPVESTATEGTVVPEPPSPPPAELPASTVPPPAPPALPPNEEFAPISTAPFDDRHLQ
jgi:hypothetical protein